MGIELAAAAVGGLISAQGSKDAANTQANAARDANSTQLQMYNQTREDQQPWRQAGQNALGQMQDPSFQKNFSMSDFQQDPGYQFRMQEGQKAIENAASRRGMGNSGATMKALTRYGQDFSTGEYNNVYNRFNADQDRRYNRLSALAGVGQTANSQVGQAGQNYANQASGNLMGAGNAAAAGQIGQANAFNSAIGQGLNFYQQNQQMKSLSDLFKQNQNPMAGQSLRDFSGVA